LFTLEQKEIFMNDQTMTFTARDAYDPDKIATFTLQNGSVSIDFGEKMRQQVAEAVDKISNEQAGVLASAAKPVASASLQTLLQPFPLEDFAASFDGDSLKTRAWVRAGGLRLAPVVLNWQQVDNPAAAAAFVDALEQRQVETSGLSRLISPLDYWLIWVLVGVTAVIVPIILRQQRDRS
jgi:hypothetical protein